MNWTEKLTAILISIDIVLFVILVLVIWHVWKKRR